MFLLDEEGERGADPGGYALGLFHRLEVSEASDDTVQQRNAAQLMDPLAQGQVIHLAGFNLLGAVAIALHFAGVIEHHKVGFRTAPGIDLDPLPDPIRHAVHLERHKVRLQHLHRKGCIRVMLIAVDGAQQAAAKHLAIAQPGTTGQPLHGGTGVGAGGFRFE